MHVFPLYSTDSYLESTVYVDIMVVVHLSLENPSSAKLAVIVEHCTIAQNLCNNYYWSGSLSSLKLFG